MFVEYVRCCGREFCFSGRRNPIILDMTITGSYSNSFSSPRSSFLGSSVWSVVDPVYPIDGPSNWHVSGGKLRQDSDIRGSSSAYGSMLIYNSKVWGNASASITTTSSDDGEVGLILRYRDRDNYYRFSVDRRLRVAKIVEVQDGHAKLLFKTTSSAVTSGNALTLQFWIKENWLMAGLDGTWHFVLSDGSGDPNYLGRAGVYTRAHRASFDNFSVTPLTPEM